MAPPLNKGRRIVKINAMCQLFAGKQAA